LLSADPNIRSSPGERPKRLAGIWVGYRKVAFGLQKLSLKLWKDSTKVTIKDQ